MDPERRTRNFTSDRSRLIWISPRGKSRGRQWVRRARYEDKCVRIALPGHRRTHDRPSGHYVRYPYVYVPTLRRDTDIKWINAVDSSTLVGTRQCRWREKADSFPVKIIRRGFPRWKLIVSGVMEGWVVLPVVFTANSKLDEPLSFKH